MNITCKAENTASARRAATVSPTSRTAITAQIAALFIALGMLLKRMPQLANADLKTGEVLIGIGRKLQAPAWKTHKVQ